MGGIWHHLGDPTVRWGTTFPGPCHMNSPESRRWRGPRPDGDSNGLVFPRKPSGSWSALPGCPSSAMGRHGGHGSTQSHRTSLRQPSRAPHPSVRQPTSTPHPWCLDRRASEPPQNVPCENTDIGGGCVSKAPDQGRVWQQMGQGFSGYVWSCSPGWSSQGRGPEEWGSQVQLPVDSARG